ncbi:MAG: ABC transporter substrate-binding protein [Candidatus Omnitrophica bacterium]|nr:ABC transporter substrate-binding protein [Candidatus Omnitrophota bacterium]
MNNRFIFRVMAVVIFLFADSAILYAKVSSDTLVLTLASDPKSFNAMVAQETSTTEVTTLMFEGLTRLNPVSGQIEPSLAMNWEKSEDGLVWTFHLRPEVKWFDGAPLTAEDVVFTFKELIYNPKIISASRDILLLEGKEIQVEAVDTHTVRFTLPTLFAPFLLAMEQPIFPAHVLREAVQKEKFSSTWGIDEKPERIIGTGPFRLKSYRGGERIELVRNERYWKKDDAGRSLPYLNRIIFLVVPNAEVRLLKFLEGETDLYNASGKDFPVLAVQKNQKNFTLYDVGPMVGSNFLVFNHNAPDANRRAWFRSDEFRRALAHGLDRQSMTDIIFNGLGISECSPVSPSTPFYFNPNTLCYDYDPQKAKLLLAAQGFQDKNGDGVLEDANGRELEFVLLTNAENPERVQMTEMVREDLSQLGIKVHFLALEFNSLVAKLVATGDWDAVVMGLTGTSDPHFGANVWFSGGSLHFWNRGATDYEPAWEKRMNEIFREGVKVLNPDARKILYDEWQAVAAEKLPLTYLVLPKVIYAIRNNFENVKPSALGGAFYNIEEIKQKS